MRKAILAVVAAFSVVSCKSIDMANVSSNEIASKGEAIAVIQASSIGFTAFLNYVVITDSSLEQVVNRLLIAEAKAMGGSKVELIHASTSPRNGIYAIPSILVGFPSSQATGIVVK
jgi:hypothetical protein